MAIMVNNIEINDETYWSIADECAGGNTSTLSSWLKDNNPNFWRYNGENITGVLSTPSCFECAISHGLDINITDEFGRNFLFQLTSLNNEDALDLAAFICSKGGDPNKKDNNGITPTHAAIRSGFIDLLKVYVNHGGDVNAVDNENRNGLFFNSGLELEPGKRVEILKYLLSLNVKINSKSSSTGWSPLMGLVLADDKEQVQILLESGADPREYSDPKVNFPKENSIEIARRIGNIEMQNILIKFS